MNEVTITNKDNKGKDEMYCYQFACPNCKGWIAETFKYCPNCGAKIKGEIEND